MRVVVNPYNSIESKGRKGLLLEEPWTDSIGTFIKEHAIKALYLNSGKGWTGDDYGFLRTLDSIEELSIIALKARNLDGIEGMRSLEELAITTTTESQVDFSKLTALQECFLSWWPA